MKLIEVLGQEREGGLCAKCERDFHADKKRRCLCEFDNPPIVEPFSLCLDCIEELKKEQ